MKRFRGMLLVAALLAATVLPAGRAAAHSGFWHFHYKRVCTFIGCFTMPTRHWHPHQHRTEEEWRAAYEKCVQDAWTLYEWRMAIAENGEFMPGERERMKELARRQLRNDLEDCKLNPFRE